MINPVNQLWPDPSLVEQPETNFDIIFLHGLQFEDGENAWEKTWKQRRDSDAVCWPQEWLPRDLGKDVRVFSLSYDADVTRKFGLGNTESVADVGRNLRESLINRDKLRIGYSPFVLVGHCLGGLVIKALVVDLYDTEGRRSKNDLDRVAKKNAKAFRENLRGIAFYGVPHSGSDFAKYAEWCTKLKPEEFSRLLMDVKPFRRNMEQLSVDFENTVGGHVNIYAFTEGLPTRVAKDSRSNKQILIVKGASAQRLARHNHYKVEDADHLQICQPTNEEHPSYAILLNFLKTCRQPSITTPHEQLEMSATRKLRFI